MYKKITENEMKKTIIDLAREMQENSWKWEDITKITVIKHLSQFKLFTPEDIDPIDLNKIKRGVNALFHLSEKYNTKI